MRVLVTGPAGQLGHDVVRAAGDAGHHAAALGRDALDLDAVGGDVARLDALLEAAGVGPDDAVVHCAAYTRVDDAEADRDAAFALNALAAGALAAACEGRGARLVLPSTDYVFDGRADRPYREDDPTGPVNVYGASKLEGERMVLAASPERAVVVRTASLFGIAGARRADAARGGNFVETMIRVGTRTGRLRVVDDVVMSPTATAHVAAAILDLLDHDAPTGIYHVVNAGQASWYDFARAIIEDAGVAADVEPVPSSEYPTPARRPAYTVLDARKAARATGRDAPDWRDALGRYLEERQRLR